MGGGPDEVSDRLLCVLTWSEESCQKSVDKLRNEFPDVEITYKYVAGTGGWTTHARKGDVAPATELDPKEYQDKTILMSTGTANCLPPKPSDFPNGCFIQFVSAGTNHVQNHPIYTDSDIKLCTSTGIHGPQIAEWAIMTTLVHSHNYNLLYEKQKAHEWGSQRDSFRTVKDMVGQRLGVLGYGSIGRQVAHVGKAMGMDVIAYTASPKDTPEKRADHGFILPGTGDPDGSIPSAWYDGTSKELLHHFLSQDIDVLLVSVPLTEKTFHLLSHDEFRVMNSANRQTPPPFIINIARGKIIDQPALVSALEDGQLRGAALDVQDPEPLPADDPLWKAPNVIITPHISGLGDVYVERCFQVLAENLRRKQAGKSLLNVVDRDRGY